MRSFTHTPPKPECPTAFSYRSDLSGMVNITYMDHSVQIRGDALLAFMAHFLRNQRVTAIEVTSDREILGLPRQGPS